MLVTLAGGRTVAVLGGMLELGDWMREEHEKIGVFLAKKGVNVLITLGDEALYIAKAAKEAGLMNIYSVTTHAEAADILHNIMKPGDTVLLKGSRSFAMEKILPYFERKE